MESGAKRAHAKFFAMSERWRDSARERSDMGGFPSRQRGLAVNQTAAMPSQVQILPHPTPSIGLIQKITISITSDRKTKEKIGVEKILTIL